MLEQFQLCFTAAQLTGTITTHTSQKTILDRLSFYGVLTFLQS